MTCYICGTARNVCCNNHCEQEGSTAWVTYCNDCAEEYISYVWEKLNNKGKGADWIHNEKDFWFLFDGYHSIE